MRQGEGGEERAGQNSNQVFSITFAVIDFYSSWVKSHGFAYDSVPRAGIDDPDLAF